MNVGPLMCVLAKRMWHASLCASAFLRGIRKSLSVYNRTLKAKPMRAWQKQVSTWESTTGPASHPQWSHLRQLVRKE